MANILLVEDEEGVVRFIKKGLQEEGFSVDVAPSGEDALIHTAKNEYDLIILDILLPRISGFDFLLQFRTSTPDTLVLILTAKDSLDDKRMGFQRGCDDYLCKPFHFEELLLRINALLKRKSAGTTTVLQVGPMRLDPDNLEVSTAERTVALTRKECALLHYLMSHYNTVLSRKHILSCVWQDTKEPETNVLDVTINSLRKKLQKLGDSPKIATVYGVGYAFRHHK